MCLPAVWDKWFAFEWNIHIIKLLGDGEIYDFDTGFRLQNLF